MDVDARFAALDARVRRLEDHERIREALAAYGFAADLGRTDAWVDLWTEDGIYDLDTGAHGGRDQLQDLIAAPANYHKSIENRSQHIAVNPLVRVDGDMAVVEAYRMLVVKQDGEARIAAGAYTRFELVRQGGAWKIRRQTRRLTGGEEWGGRLLRDYLAAG